jgi:hypothetical protein
MRLRTGIWEQNDGRSEFVVRTTGSSSSTGKTRTTPQPTTTPSTATDITHRLQIFHLHIPVNTFIGTYCISSKRSESTWMYKYSTLSVSVRPPSLPACLRTHVVEIRSPSTRLPSFHWIRKLKVSYMEQDGIFFFVLQC